MSDVHAAPRPLTVEEVAALLRATGEAIVAELGGACDDVAEWHPGGREWCLKEVLGHLIEAEWRGFAGRIDSIVRQPGVRLEPWDQEAMARERRDCEKPLRELLDGFAELRGRGLEIVGNLRNVDLDKSGEHAEIGALRVDELLHEWIWHDRDHHRQIMANVQGYVWRSMGATRRFYE